MSDKKKDKLTPEQRASLERAQMWHDDPRGRVWVGWDCLGPVADDYEPDGPTDRMARELGLPPIPKGRPKK